ncbi:MAG: 50S ribosomal protein L18 [bacterium]|nr:50S ribosomal protein L18 [bacterium]
MRSQALKTKLRKRRTRAKLSGTAKRPRLSVFRSNKFTYAQLIDDESMKTVVSVSTRSIDGKGKTEKAKSVGEALAAEAKKAGISTVLFDRGHYKYHGRVKAVAEGARASGLKF